MVLPPLCALQFFFRGVGVEHLFEAGRLLTFLTYRMGAYLRWALIRGWALNRINTVYAEQCIHVRSTCIIIYLAQQCQPWLRFAIAGPHCMCFWKFGNEFVVHTFLISCSSVRQSENNIRKWTDRPLPNFCLTRSQSVTSLHHSTEY